MSRDLLSQQWRWGQRSASAFDKVSRVANKHGLALIDPMRDTIGIRAIGAKLQAPSVGHVKMIKPALYEKPRLDIIHYALSRDET